MKTREKIILHDHNQDGLDRRGFLECMAWAGTGMLWTVGGGLLTVFVGAARIFQLRRAAKKNLKAALTG